MGGVEKVISSRSVKRHVYRKTRLNTTKIIGIASVIIAAIALIPPFVGAFWTHDDRNAGSCIKIGNISDLNGIPQVVAYRHFRVEMRARGHEYTYWLVLTLYLFDGSVHVEERRIEEIPGVVIFPIDLLSVDGKRHILMVNVDIVGATDVPAGCLLVIDRRGAPFPAGHP